MFLKNIFKELVTFALEYICLIPYGNAQVNLQKTDNKIYSFNLNKNLNENNNLNNAKTTYLWYS